MMSALDIREGRRGSDPRAVTAGWTVDHRPPATNQRARGLNPRALGINPRAQGTNPNPRKAESYTALTGRQEARRDDLRARWALRLVRAGAACSTCHTGTDPDCPRCAGAGELPVELCPCNGTGWVAASQPDTVRRCPMKCRPPAVHRM